MSLEEILEQDGREPVGDSDLHEELMVNEEINILKCALASLPEDYREILTLRYLNELTISEIAKITGKKSATIYVSVHRGLRLLREALVEAEPFNNKDQ